MTTSSRKSPLLNPMELVDRYLQSVRFWTPKSQQDLVAELAEDLRSQIDEKENELGHPLDEDEVSAILKRCGNPILVASRLGPKRHLIGPELYPIYLFVLKMVLLWILVPVFLFIVGPVEFANSGNWGSAIGSTIAQLWSGVFVAAGIITLVFAIIERTASLQGAHAHHGIECKWDPLTLPPLQQRERKTSLKQTASELIFNIFGLVYLLLLPQHPFLLLGPAASFLKAAPLWHTFYIPILLLTAGIILRLAVILIRPQWSVFPLWSHLLQTTLSLIVLHFMLNAVGQAPGTDWHPFVVLADGLQNARHYIGIAAVVNVSILVSMVCVWIGLCIAAVVQLWQLMKYVMKRDVPAQQPASMHVL